MTFKEFIACGGSIDALVSVLDDFFIAHDEYDPKKRCGIECLDHDEAIYVLFMLKEHSYFDLGFDIEEYRTVLEEWTTIFYNADIHFGAPSCCKTRIPLEDFLVRCLSSEKLPDLDVELPDIMEILS